MSYISKEIGQWPLGNDSGVSELEFGKVKFFDSRETKRFGFLVTFSGEEIFFHYNDGQQIIDGPATPIFSGKSTVVHQGKTYHLREPKIDDNLVFQRSSGSKGDKASPWSYASTYDNCVAFIAQRRVYRVLEVMNSIGQPGGEPKVLWEGSYIPDLLQRYPVPSGNRSPGSDPLLPYYADNDNIFEVRRWWERRYGDDWIPCKDPRPLTPVLRQFEAISRR